MTVESVVRLSHVELEVLQQMEIAGEEQPSLEVVYTSSDEYVSHHEHRRRMIGGHALRTYPPNGFYAVT